MNKPSIGRIVHYHHTADDRRNAEASDGVAWPAVITKVNADGTINVRAFSDGNGVPHRKNLKQGALEGQWEWPIIEAAPIAAPAASPAPSSATEKPAKVKKPKTS